MFDPNNEADWDTREMQERAREEGRGLARMRAHYRAGRLTEAAGACPHGWEYPLRSKAAADDPHEGADGYRCIECGSRLAESSFDTPDPRVLVACEIPPRTNP